MTKVNKIKIKQVRSGIDHPADQKRTLRALGFTKMNQVIEKDGTPQVLGMIRKVHHLVDIVK